MQKNTSVEYGLIYLMFISSKLFLWIHGSTFTVKQNKGLTKYTLPNPSTPQCAHGFRFTTWFIQKYCIIE